MQGSVLWVCFLVLFTLFENGGSQFVEEVGFKSYPGPFMDSSSANPATRKIVFGGGDVPSVQAQAQQIAQITGNFLSLFKGLDKVASVLDLMFNLMALAEEAKSPQIVDLSPMLSDVEKKIIDGDLNLLLSRQEVIHKFLTLFEYENLTSDYIRSAGFGALSELSSSIKAFEGASLRRYPLETGPSLCAIVRLLNVVTKTIASNQNVFFVNGQSPETDDALLTAMNARDLVIQYVGGSFKQRRDSISITYDPIVESTSGGPTGGVARNSQTCTIRDRYIPGGIVYRAKDTWQYGIGSPSRLHNSCNTRFNQYVLGILDSYVSYYSQCSSLLYETDLMKIRPSGRFYSPDRKFFARLQPDGNFVIVHRSRGVIWSTGTANRGTPPYEVFMQADGNLVIYDSKQVAIWSTGTHDRPETRSPYRLRMDNEGVLSIRDSNNFLIWHSGSTDHLYMENEPLISHNQQAIALPQDDGNLVVYQHGNARWAPNKFTSARPGFHLALQKDGNLVVYQGGVENKVPWWSSGTNGRCQEPYLLKLHNDGNLAVYCGPNHATRLWCPSC